MKSLILLTIALFSLPALSATKNTYSIETKLTLNDKPQFTSTMLTTEGEKSSF